MLSHEDKVTKDAGFDWVQCECGKWHLAAQEFFCGQVAIECVCNWVMWYKPGRKNDKLVRVKTRKVALLERYVEKWGVTWN